MYRLYFNETEGLLETTLCGFWTVETVHAFDKEMARTIAKYAPRFPNFPILSDSRALSLMSAEASEAWAKASGESSRRHQCRIAIIVEGALSKMQARRVVSLQDKRFFTDFGEARRWLLNG